MGYYTQFSLSEPESCVPGKRLTGDEYMEILGTKVSAYSFTVAELLDDGFYGKWYDWVEDMLELSKKYPDVLFTLDGAGEEPGDIWSCWFADGKKYFATVEMRYPEMPPVEEWERDD